MTLMTSTGSAFTKLFSMSLEFNVPHRTLTAEGLGGVTLNFPSPKRLGTSKCYVPGDLCEARPFLWSGLGISHSLGMSTVKWYYKSRIHYDHSSCSRCMWRGTNFKPPSLCSPCEVRIPGSPWLELSFCKRRVNRLQVIQANGKLTTVSRGVLQTQ